MDEADELIVSISEFVKNRLYFITFNDMPDLTQGGPGVHYFCTDELFRYENFYDDFGPLNLSMLYRYCHALNLKLRQVKSTRIIHSTSSDPQKRVNAAYLIGCYAILYLNFTPQEAYETLTANSKERLIDFRDASSAEPHTISLMDCLAGLFKAKQMNFFDFANFDFEHYEFYERVENGDLNWLVPRKFLAFCGPYNACENIGNYPVHGVAFYHRYFRSNGVSTVVRLNKRAYNASLFTRAGFAHRDLYFLDGSTPTDEILYEFLQICEGTTGAIAVHCKAGLGRTGTLIGCYIMKHYRFTAREAIAWIRICRPGSIIGPQQEWLQSKMSEMWHDGQVYRRRRWRAPQGVPALPIHRTPIYTIRAGHPFAGIASKYHRQHIRLHCRIVGQSRFADTSNKDESKAATTAPAQDAIKARRMLKQKRNQTAALARSNAYKVIRHVVEEDCYENETQHNVVVIEIIDEVDSEFEEADICVVIDSSSSSEDSDEEEQRSVCQTIKVEELHVVVDLCDADDDLEAVEYSDDGSDIDSDSVAAIVSKFTKKMADIDNTDDESDCDDHTVTANNACAQKNSGKHSDEEEETDNEINADDCVEKESSEHRDTEITDCVVDNSSREVSGRINLIKPQICTEFVDVVLAGGEIRLKSESIIGREGIEAEEEQEIVIIKDEEHELIQRKVNTMNLDDTSEKVVQDQLDTDDDCGDSEYSDTDVDIASNNNNPTNKMKDVETTEESEVEQEVEINANIQSKSNINNNNNITKVNNRGAKLGNITQGDKLNEIKAQRTRYPRSNPKSIESTSAVTAAKIVRACQPPIPSASSGSRTDARVSNAKRRGCTSMYSATASACALGSNELSVRSIRRTSPRLAAQAAAAAVAARSAAKGKSSSSSCSASSGEDITTTNSPIRPNANIWVSRVVPNNPAENATASNVATLSGMEVERETRAKRALISERRIVKVFRKSNQGPNGAAAITGAPIKTRKVDDSAVNQ